MNRLASDPEAIEHGLNAYTNYLCRCEVCRFAKACENYEAWYARATPRYRIQRAIVLKLI